jgi:predicted esterase
MKQKIIRSLIISLCFFQYLGAQTRQSPDSLYEPLNPDIKKESFIYATKDSAELGLDVYSKGSATVKKPCIIFVFGGAFVRGKRDSRLYNNYFNSIVQHDFICISISYRLGMKGVTNVSVLNTAPLKKAVDMAVEDLYDATNWVITHRDELGIDTGKIIISGSSAGGITVQTAEFNLCNQLPIAQKLPQGFKYAGIITFSGAVLTYEGKLRYKEPPAPALMFHGTADKIVTYNKIRFFNKGFYGSGAISKAFKNNDYPFHMYSEEGLGHEVSVLPMIIDHEVIFDFINDFVLNRKAYQMETTFKDQGMKPMLTMSAKQMFEKMNNPAASQAK